MFIFNLIFHELFYSPHWFFVVFVQEVWHQTQCLSFFYLQPILFNDCLLLLLFYLHCLIMKLLNPGIYSWLHASDNLVLMAEKHSVFFFKSIPIAQHLVHFYCGPIFFERHFFNSDIIINIVSWLRLLFNKMLCLLFLVLSNLVEVL